MATIKSFPLQLYTCNDRSFQDIALSLFRFQAENNAVYKSFIQYLGIRAALVDSLDKIPFLPISFFKNHSLKTGEWPTAVSFSSSGTTGQRTSIHSLPDLAFYLNHAEKCFNHFFGDLKNYNFMALLPSYLERKNSSLVAMMDHFIRKSESPYSGFYLNNISDLLRDLDESKLDHRKTILWGVTFALLDLAESTHPDISHCMVFETGGMKGRRKEITRLELHSSLQQNLHISKVYSEYGMTELLSQAYSLGADRFYCPPWMKIIGRDITDPMKKGLLEEISGINVIDLANQHSIAFIETEDIGKIYPDGSFEVLGRLDNSDLRGCSLLVE